MTLVVTPISPLHIADFRAFWVSRFAGVLAQNMMVVVLGWQAYEVSRSHYGMTINAASFQLGLVGLVQFLPLFVLTPFAGLAADRYDRRRIGQLALGLDGLIATLLCWATAQHAITLPLLFIGSAAHGMVRAFVGPALSSLAPNLVPSALLPRAIAINSIAWQLASVGGPMLGGLLYAVTPPLPYGLTAVLVLIAIIALHIIEPVAQTTKPASASPLTQIGDGFAYVWRHKMLLGCISLDLFAVLLGGATAMLPAYARDILLFNGHHVGETGLGVLRAAPAVGAAVTALLLSARPITDNVGVKMLGAVGVFGIATAVFGWSQSMLLSLAMLVILGAADMVSVFIRGSLTALYTPDEMRGRVNAASGLFISASNELGEAESGLLAAAVGPVVAVVAGGIAAIAITLLWARVFPVLRTTRTFNPPPKESLI